MGCSNLHRSFFFDKLTIVYRLYKLCLALTNKYEIKNIVFHADMQVVEALTSILFQVNNFYYKTFALQHALFYDTDDQSDLNSVNLRVSPSLYSIVWNKEIGQRLCQYNENKKILYTERFPSSIINIANHEFTSNSILIVLDGPNNIDYNNDLLSIVKEFSTRKNIKNVYFKPHPNYRKKEIDSINEKFGFVEVKEIEHRYKIVFFISSTLGYEMEDYCDELYQFIPKMMSLKIKLAKLDSSFVFHRVEDLFQSNILPFSKKSRSKRNFENFYKSFADVINSVC